MCVNELQAGLKGLLCLITTRRNFSPFLLWSLMLFNSRFKFYTFFLQDYR